MSEKWESVVKGGKHKAKSQLSMQERKQIKVNKKEILISNSTAALQNSKTKTNINNKDLTDVNIVQQSTDTVLSPQILLNIKEKHKELLERFPNQQTKVLIDLALYINPMLNNATDLLKYSGNTTLRGLFNGINNAQLGNFLKSAMIQILDRNDIGLTLLVQTCLKLKPIALITNRNSIFDLLKMYRDNTSKFICLVSILRDACLNFNIASQIWLIYLLPFLNQRCHTSTVLQFGEEITRCAVEAGGNDGVVHPADLIFLLEMVNTNVEDVVKKGSKKTASAIFQLSAADLRRLRDIYVKIRQQIFSSISAKSFFGPLFIKLSTGDKNKGLNNDLLDCLDRCLIHYPESVMSLGDLHYDYPQQTILLLEHLSTGPSTAAKMVKKQNFFKATIKKVNSSTTTAAPGTTQHRLHKQTSAKSTSVGGCCAALFKAFFYSTLICLLAFVVLRSQFPKQYNAVVEVGSPYAATALNTVHNSIYELWILSKPYVDVAAVRARQGGQYIYAKVDEVAPSAVERLSDIYILFERFLDQQYDAVSLYLNSAQFQDSVKTVADRVSSVIIAVRSAYRSALSSVVTMVGL